MTPKTRRAFIATRDGMIKDCVALSIGSRAAFHPLHSPHAYESMDLATLFCDDDDIVLYAIDMVMPTEKLAGFAFLFDDSNGWELPAMQLRIVGRDRITSPWTVQQCQDLCVVTAMRMDGVDASSLGEFFARGSADFRTPGHRLLPPATSCPYLTDALHAIKADASAMGSAKRNLQHSFIRLAKAGKTDVGRELLATYRKIAQDKRIAVAATRLANAV